MGYPPVVIVDENDQEVGLALLRDAWEQGLTYRTVQVMVEDGQGKVLLQKRASSMELFPGRWEVSVAGHVDKGFTYESAAKAEVVEELGIENFQLEEVGSYFIKRRYPGRIMRHFSKVYRMLDTSEGFTPDVHEVGELRWFTIEDAKRLVSEHPEQTTDVLREVLQRYY